MKRVICRVHREFPVVFRLEIGRLERRLFRTTESVPAERAIALSLGVALRFSVHASAVWSTVIVFCALVFRQKIHFFPCNCYERDHFTKLVSNEMMREPVRDTWKVKETYRRIGRCSQHMVYRIRSHFRSIFLFQNTLNLHLVKAKIFAFYNYARISMKDKFFWSLHDLESRKTGLLRGELRKFATNGRTSASKPIFSPNPIDFTLNPYSLIF